MATGDNIRRHRKAKGFTQAQLADAVGLTEGAIRHYESGIRAVKPELLEKIAKALEVSEGALKDYGVETAQDLMALLLQLEEGYGLVPSEDGMGLAVDPKAPHAPRRRMPQSLRSRSRPGRKSALSLSAEKSTRPLTPTGRHLSDIFLGKLTFPCEQPPVFRGLFHYSRTVECSAVPPSRGIRE